MRPATALRGLMRRYQLIALLVAAAVGLVLHVNMIRKSVDGLVDQVDALTKHVMEVQAEVDSVRITHKLIIVHAL